MENRASKKPLKVLIIDEEVPYPPDAGKRIRTWNLLNSLAQKHSVHLLCYGRDQDSSSIALRSAGIALHLVNPLQESTGFSLYLRLMANLFSPYPFSVTKHYSGSFRRAFNDLQENGHWDLIHCEWTPYARFFSSRGTTPTLIATHNVESQIWRRRAECSKNFLERIFFGLQEAKMLWFERRALRRATAVTAVTEADAETMRKWGARAVTVVPNGVDLAMYLGITDQKQVENEILSVASLDWFPNIDAIEYFVNEIFPSIQKALPNIVFRIVGRRPTESLRAKLSAVPGIDFVGEVKDVRSYLDRAAVIVVPLRIGGGSRLKILEALAAGKAVVSTSVGAEGLDLNPGKDVLIADSPQDFARGVINLLLAKAARRELGANGRKLVTEKYGWNEIGRRLEAIWLETAGQQLASELVRASARESYARS
jgi:glycosyltransferase involved in cell wall biosynthesis